MRRLVLAIVVLAACGGSSDGDGDDGGTGGGGEVDLVLDHHDFGGDLTIEGTVFLPLGRSTRQARIQVYDVFAPNSQIAHTTYSVSPMTTMRYRVEQLAEGQAYKVYVEADLDDDNDLDGPADARGFYDGSADAPLVTYEEGTEIQIDSEPVTDADFGIGPG